MMSIIGDLQGLDSGDGSGRQKARAWKTLQRRRLLSTRSVVGSLIRFSRSSEQDDITTRSWIQLCKNLQESSRGECVQHEVKETCKLGGSSRSHVDSNGVSDKSDISKNCSRMRVAALTPFMLLSQLRLTTQYPTLHLSCQFYISAPFLLQPEHSVSTLRRHLNSISP